MVLDFVVNLFDAICGLLGVPDVPQWVTDTWDMFVADVLSAAVPLFSWIFPTEDIYISFMNILFDCCFILLMFNMFKFLISLYHKVIR